MLGLNSFWRIEGERKYLTPRIEFEAVSKSRKGFTSDDIHCRKKWPEGENWFLRNCLVKLFACMIFCNAKFWEILQNLLKETFNLSTGKKKSICKYFLPYERKLLKCRVVNPLLMTRNFLESLKHKVGKFTIAQN